MRRGCSRFSKIGHDAGCHQLAPLVEQIAATVGGLGFVLNRMGQGLFTNLARKIGLLGRPISKSRTVLRRRFSISDARFALFNIKRDIARICVPIQPTFLSDDSF